MCSDVASNHFIELKLNESFDTIVDVDAGADIQIFKYSNIIEC